MYPDNGYTHWLFPYGQSQYYKEIGKYSQWSAGWDDGISGPLTPGQLPLSYESPHYVEYRNARAEADRLNSLASTWAGVVVVNHILSAADAFWSAKQHNSSLHSSLELRLTPTPYGMVPEPVAHLQYYF
jgi:hypothetical protein